MSAGGQDTNSGTLLQYVINPPQVFVGTTTDLTLVITNPLNSGNTVTLRPGAQGDMIEVTFTGPQAVTGDFNFGAQSQTQGFAAGSSSPGSGVFNVQPTTVQNLAPGQSVKVLFPAVVINGQTGPAQVKVEEFIGESDQQSVVAVQRVAQELRVISWMDPGIVGLGQTSTLRWISFSGTRVKVSGFMGGTGEKTFDVHGDPPYPDSTPVGVPDGEGFRPYTLTVYSNDGQHANHQSTVYLNKPLINSFVGDPAAPGPIKTSQAVQLNWSTIFGQYAYLNTPTANIPVDVNPSSPVRVVPGDDAYAASNGAQISDVVTYELWVGGYNQPASRPVKYNLSPVKVVYFKYGVKDPGTGKLSRMISKLDPPRWPGINIHGVSNDLFKMVVKQPGGNDTVWWLGAGDTTHPQVQFFDAAAGAGGKFTLSWVTANLKSLTLGWNDGSPQSYPVPADQVASGSYEVTPQRATEYTLTATGTNGEVVTSTLTVGGPS